ncbi:hypothetical protein KDW_36220 [Dictyobacter vulcani]|uniref:Phenylacetate-CoA oxygenase subunit PaaI n=1 Tax=Dictyobacter vulcani TaxID=2607529 RepID=A0A5J4KSN4_9CHLR|nr:Phenylacetic acid catabolic protein [Dictyobacter vulcani]GER89460.1 hypothetical protein KDW_36220 [Dictyobacter vulcani]
MMKMADATSVPVELRQPLSNMLLALADDEFILGYWDSEWTGVAPMLEEDVACSSIAQDEIGHARLFYQEVAALTGVSPDDIAYGRKIEDYRQIQLVEHRRGNWAFTIARRFYYETAIRSLAIWPACKVRSMHHWPRQSPRSSGKRHITRCILAPGCNAWPMALPKLASY